MPVASCSLAEPELVEIGAEAATGTSSSSVYFESIDSAGQPRPSSRPTEPLPGRRPDLGRCGSRPTSRCICWPRAVRRAGTADMTAVRAALPHVALDAPQGQVQIDRDNRHCYLTPRIGISNRGVRLRHHLRGAGAGQAGPISGLAGAPVAARPPRRRPAAAGRSNEPRPIQNFRGRHALVLHRRRPEPSGARDHARQAGPRRDRARSAAGRGRRRHALPSSVDLAFLDVDIGALPRSAVRPAAPFRWSR